MNRVLIVDDKPENLYLLRALLQGNGYTVDEAYNGADALLIAHQNPPTIVVSDLLMPVMDGYTLLRNWKADEELKSIPFVVYTATYTDPKDERHALNLGAAAFIIKPAEPETFMERIREVLARQDRGQPPMGNEVRLGENDLLKEYSDVLVRKLEAKVDQLEQANLALQKDIVERKRMENELRLRDRAIQAVSQGIVITDPNQTDNPIIYASAGFQRITGYTPEEILGRNCRFLQGKDTDRHTLDTLREAIAARHSCEVEILNYRKDGTPFWNALSLNPIDDENGGLAYFVGVLSDVSERRNLEEQLRQSQKMEAIGQLAGGIAHDFNNLLTIIYGFSEILLSTPELNDSMRESVKAISHAGERAASLTRQLLGFSRRTLLQPYVLDLNAVVEETANMLRRLIGEDIEFTTVLDPTLAQVRVDPGQLDQMLMNLAVNARDAMPIGGKLTIETSNVSLSEHYVGQHLDLKAGEYVQLAISDTGCGMTPDVKARIFEPFFTTKAVGKGTGLGLAMVFGIVQQSGGAINVYSEPGLGTTFKVYFPAVKEPITKKSVSASKIGLAGTETILLVEDDEGVRALALASLTMYGYTVLTAADGQEALRVIRDHAGSVDLVLTDVVMPNISGPELTETLRVQSPRIKILYMSGYTDDAVVRHGLLQANVSFIQKPYTPAGLVRKVRQVLDEGNNDPR